MNDAAIGDELLRWGLEVDGLNAEATRLGGRMERVLRGARKAVERARRQLEEVRGRLDPADEQARRIEEVARASGDSAVRTDLLALNFQVEAARLGEDDRGLEKVAHEIRTLSDRGARGAAEVSDLAGALGRDAALARSAIRQGTTSLDRAVEEVERAALAADAAATALARARGAAAEFAAGVRAAASRPEGLTVEDLEAVRRLAAAIEVRDGTIAELARATSSRLWRTHHALLDEAGVAREGTRRLESQLHRLTEMAGLVDDADEIARRAKQLALNADLAAARAEDPAFVLFAEEARRLSEQADNTANQTQSQLQRTRKALTPEIARSRGHTDALLSLAAELAELLDRFGGVEPEPGEGEDDDLERAWREDRAAAEQLAEARAKWLHSSAGFSE